MTPITRRDLELRYNGPIPKSELRALEGNQPLIQRAKAQIRLFRDFENTAQNEGDRVKYSATVQKWEAELEKLTANNQEA